MTPVGGDPGELRAVARAGPGQAFLLDHRARVLDAARSRHEQRNRHSRVACGPAVDTVRSLGRRSATLDAWVLQVAAALEAGDAEPLRQHLLALGAAHPATAHLAPDRPLDPRQLRATRLTASELDELAGRPRLPVAWRDRLHRERARRWIDALPRRLAEVPDDHLRGPGGWLSRWVDRVVVDRVSLVTDLHVTQDERRERLVAEVAGLQRLLAHPGMTLLSFDPTGPTPRGGPAARVALGDVEAADHLAVVLPGTSVGLRAPAAALRDTTALHAAVHRTSDAQVATVLDLYDAPIDLGRAADPRTGDAAGRATAAFLDDLHATLQVPPRTTLVGHSYGAYTAARAARAAPERSDALVLLGAPGAGATHRGALGLRPSTEVWAARAPGDPIMAVADLDELLLALPASVRVRLGPLLEPDAAFGPDPVDPEFGALRLPTGPSPGAPGTPARGHVSYLTRGTASLAAVAAVVAGRDPRVRPVRPPRRARRARAADD